MSWKYLDSKYIPPYLKTSLSKWDIHPLYSRTVGVVRECMKQMSSFLDENKDGRDWAVKALKIFKEFEEKIEAEIEREDLIRYV